MIIKTLNKIIQPTGYQIAKKQSPISFDLQNEKEFLEFYKQCKPYTQTTVERLFALYQSCLYIINNKIPGDLVECGVWRGGSSMMIALTFLSRDITNRNIYMYDTYEGMSEPTVNDVAITGENAASILQRENKLAEDSIWCYASYDEVLTNMAKTNYPIQHIKMIKGKVEDTLPLTQPTQIALLRLDTDWYESTKIELELLFPKLEKHAPLIIDDFGHWEGAKKAVIEYFQQQNIQPLLQRIDFTGRLMLKL